MSLIREVEQAGRSEKYARKILNPIEFRFSEMKFFDWGMKFIAESSVEVF